MLKSRIKTAFVAAATISVVCCSAFAVNPTVPEAKAVLSVELFSLGPIAPEKTFFRRDFHEYSVRRKARVTKPADVRKVMESITTSLDQRPDLKQCFDPDRGVRINLKAATEPLDFLISFSCKSAIQYQDVWKIHFPFGDASQAVMDDFLTERVQKK